MNARRPNAVRIASRRLSPPPTFALDTQSEYSEGRPPWILTCGAVERRRAGSFLLVLPGVAPAGLGVGELKERMHESCADAGARVGAVGVVADQTQDLCGLSRCLTLARALLEQR
jgi:hypothetical protein